MNELNELIEIYSKTNNFLYDSIACDGCPIEACKDFHADILKCLKELKAYREATQETFKLTQAEECGRGIRLCMDVYNEHLKELKKDD